MFPAFFVEFVIAAIAGAFIFGAKNNADVTAGTGTMPQPGSNQWGLPDIDPSLQKGGFSGVYDQAFQAASAQTGVPFALIKAHSIRESSLNPNAYHFDNNTVGASYGLMQVEWVYGSNRFSKYGVDDSEIGADGSGLYDETLNAFLGASIIRDNLNWLKGNLRDEINAYNTGHAESGGAAPANYVNDVLSYYSKIVGGTVG